MRRRENAVELTPLLDVILIMLFLIISRSRDEAQLASDEADARIRESEAAYSEEIAAARADLEAVQGELSEARERLYYADNRIHAYEKFDRYSVIVSISLRETDEGREIYISDGSETRRISFDWDNMRYGENSLKNALGKYDDSEYPVFMVFSYDSSRVYQRDFDMISSVLSSVQADNGNVYIKFDERSDPNGKGKK